MFGTKINEYRVFDIQVVSDDNPMQEESAFEIRKKILFGLAWSVVDPDKDVVFSEEDLDKRLNDLESIDHLGEEVKVSYDRDIDLYN